MVRELSYELSERGYNVTVCTTIVRNRMIPNKNGAIEINDNVIENGVKIIRVDSIHQFSSNFIIRGLSLIFLPYLLYKRIKKINNKIDVVFAYSSSLAWAELGCMIKKKYGARFILNVQDIFPQNAIDLGVLNNKFLIKYFDSNPAPGPTSKILSPFFIFN